MTIRMTLTKGARFAEGIVGCFLPEPVENAIAAGWLVSLKEVDEPLAPNPEFQAIMGEIMDAAMGEVTHELITEPEAIDKLLGSHINPDNYRRPAVLLSLSTTKALGMFGPDSALGFWRWWIFQVAGYPRPTPREIERFDTYLQTVDTPGSPS